MKATIIPKRVVNKIIKPCLFESDPFGIVTGSKIEKIGGFNKTAEDFVNYLYTFKDYYEDIKDVLKPLVKEEIISLPIKNDIINDTSLKGKNYCFSGIRDKELENNIVLKGGKVSDTITKSITHLVVLDINGSSSKIEKAKKYGINIVSIDNLKKEI